jgi:hypothetical protein
MQEKYEEAETFFEAAACVDEKSILAWTALGKTSCSINHILLLRAVENNSFSI